MNTGQWLRDAGIAVSLATIVVIGVLAIGTAPVAAAGNQADDPPGFDFGDDSGSGFGFESDDGSPGFDFGDNESGFDFGGEEDDGPGFDFDSGNESGFDFGGDDDSPNFGGDDGDSDGPDFGGDNETSDPGFGGDDGDSDGPDFGGDNETSDPGFGGNESDGNQSDGGTDPAVPANFQLSGVSTNSPVTAGDTVEVTATVENVGEQESTQTVSLKIGGAERDTRSVQLASGASTTVTLSWTTQSGDAADYTATVSTANDTATAGVTVAAQPDPANFQVSNLQTNSPVTEGETLTVDATVQNVGDQQGTQTVTLTALGASDDRQVTLASGASTTVSLSVATQAGDAGQFSASVTTANDTASTSVQVKAPNAPADFQVSGVSSDSPVTAGEALDVTATVQNVGDQQGTQTVTLSVGGTERASQSVTLAGGASQTVTLTWQTTAGDAGNYTATVGTVNDTGTTDVAVTAQPDPANFQLSGVSTNSPVTAGDTVSVTATVTNTGDLQGTQTVQLTDGSATLASQSVTLAGGASQTVTLTWQTAAGDAGNYSLRVRTVNDTATASVSVTEQPTPANFAVSQVSAPGSVTAGDTVSVTATVTNTGDQQGTQDVSLGVGGSVDSQVDSQSVTLAGGASQTVTLTWQTQAGQTGNFSLSVLSVNDSASTTVTVAAQPDPASFQLSGTSNNSPVTAGNAVEVTTTVQNTGDQQGTQTVALSVGGTERASQSVTLAGGASQTVTLTWQTAAGDAGNYTATVSTANDTSSTSVTVEAQPDPANFQVSNLQTNSPVTAGSPLNVTVTVTNTGDKSGTQTVRLGIRSSQTSDSQADKQSLTLAGGESQQVTLTWQTAAGDAGNYTAGVFTLNDSARTGVRVNAQPDPAVFEVGIDSTNSPVTAGQTLDVTATITNTGDLEGTQTIRLGVAGAIQDSQSVTLAGGASQTVTLSWQTAAGDAGNYTARVASQNFAADTSVRVNAQPDPANLTITSTSSNSPVTEGQTLTVDATLRNDGDLQGTQTVDLTVANTVRDSQQVTLAAGASQTVTLSWTTQRGDAGSYTATVETANDSARTGVTVESAAIQPTSFQGVAEDGYVEINGSSGQRFDLKPCPDGQPLNDTYQCLGVNATVNGNSWSAAPSDVTFPNQTATGPFGGTLTIVVTTPNGLSGTIDTETGRMTVNGTLQIRVPDLRAGCGTSFVVNATTGTSGTLTGTPLNVSNGIARGTIVDGLFSVPGASGCGSFLNRQLNGQVGIPSESGQNELKLDLYLDLQTAS